MKTLEANGEKLRQLTGEDHGPFRAAELFPDLSGEDLPGPENEACPNDMGFDRETGPLGCVLELHGKTCECAARFSARQE